MKDLGKKILGLLLKMNELPPEQATIYRKPTGFWLGEKRVSAPLLAKMEQFGFLEVGEREEVPSPVRGGHASWRIPITMTSLGRVWLQTEAQPKEKPVTNVDPNSPTALASVGSAWSVLRDPRWNWMAQVAGRIWQEKVEEGQPIVFMTVAFLDPESGAVVAHSMNPGSWDVTTQYVSDLDKLDEAMRESGALVNVSEGIQDVEENGL